MLRRFSVQCDLCEIILIRKHILTSSWMRALRPFLSLFNFPPQFTITFPMTRIFCSNDNFLSLHWMHLVVLLPSASFFFWSETVVCMYSEKGVYWNGGRFCGDKRRGTVVKPFNLVNRLGIASTAIWGATPLKSRVDITVITVSI